MGIVIELGEGVLNVVEILMSRGWVRGGGYLIKDLGRYYWLAEIRGSMVLFNCGLEEYSLEVLHECTSELSNEVSELSRILGIPVEVGKVELTI